jgi:hypothetical protein
VQVTTSVYDEVGRVIRTQAPDSLWTTNEYYLTGLYRKTTGARVYPVEYTFDYAGRLSTMTTWQDYASSAGAAVTQWKYESTRGFLTNKVYQGTNGPGYTYTKAGRLGTRPHDQLRLQQRGRVAGGGLLGRLTPPRKTVWLPLVALGR